MVPSGLQTCLILGSGLVSCEVSDEKGGFLFCHAAECTQVTYIDACPGTDTTCSSPTMQHFHYSTLLRKCIATGADLVTILEDDTCVYALTGGVAGGAWWRVVPVSHSVVHAGRSVFVSRDKHLSC